MEENPRLLMYEAQAIAIEKQLEIDRLTAENVKLTERLRLFEQDREEKAEGSSQRSLNDVWTAINGLTQLVKTLQEQNHGDFTRLQQKMDKNSTKTWTTINQLRTGLNQFLKPKQKFKEGNTILLIGGNSPNNIGLILSDDRSNWIEIHMETPYKAWTSGIVHLNEEIYLIGGYKSPKSLYKLGKNLKWTRLKDMNMGRGGITNSCLAWNGFIWVFGGEDENGSHLKCVERYDPKEDTWTRMTEMRSPRSRTAVTLLNSGIIISGGIDNNTVEWYHQHDDYSEELPNMPTALYGHSIVSYKNRLILMGDDGRRLRKNVWEFDIENLKWRPLTPMEYPSTQYAGVVLDKEIYKIGGRQSECQDRVEIFDGKEWRDGPQLPYNIFDVSHVIIPQEFANNFCTYE